MAYPKNVGIKAMEIYVPAQCLDQSLFEKHQSVSAGKYTIGLGLQYMNYCTDREDVCSLALTAVSSLLRKFNIDPTSIGRLEVGTESLIDKAKSIKSVLTTLFEPSGNTSLEGVDNIHACYGGTNALFNAVNWVESRSWDGRDAIVVASDIALYKEASSRPTGGAGCVAMLVGPNALLSFEPSLRGPDLKVEFPILDGYGSIVCYLSAVDGCHKDLLRRANADRNRLGRNKSKGDLKGEVRNGSNDEQKVLDLFDYMAFHTPNCKLVSKSYGRLKYNDCLNDGDWEGIPDELQKLGYQESLKDKALEKALVAVTKNQFKERVEPCIVAPSLCGNMYTASLYCSLISLVSNIDLEDAEGKTIGMFSYGSGAASTLFGLKVTGDLTDMVQKIDLMNRLKQRHISTPEEYEEACALRMNAYGSKSYKPVGDVASLVPGTYYLENIDNAYQRTYVIKQ
ncbi:hydroxymethylglutaryl-CoA synthase-like protein [Aspergillus heteromorphus CBS 117.55]|uniref:Hydroxymethylglutaryl-CoA synthase n=1 Tax=Aspergillus heteromorphus CBS 117.55 TaxID=1448321 RepID=A0A317V1L0_9EURO|nr:hydroxymethylglutaryl-CoA synthase-like protein [Aspergillus heteromorphus CBS 117.55]PWY67876.1 hydroxymethylglutaryl-CoA synthase-like protein [Aspergillus heteromorphus CBS 117.55]